MHFCGRLELTVCFSLLAAVAVGRDVLAQTGSPSQPVSGQSPEAPGGTTLRVTGDSRTLEGATALWSSHVETLLAKHCHRCHGELKQKANLDLRTPTSILRGGKRGAAVVPGDPDASHLVRFVLPGSDPHMPPGQEQLSKEEIATLRSWVQRIDPSQAQGNSPSPPASDPVAGPAVLGGVSNRATDVWIPPSGTSPRLVIDLSLEGEWIRRGVAVSPFARDEAFLRRLTLDLIGRIPTRREMDAFLAETSSQKRERAIDRLLDSREHARHLADVFDTVLMGVANSQKVASRRRSSGWREYLERSFLENRPWNQIAAELLAARPKDEQDRGAVWFLYERRAKPQAVAEAVAPALFGVQIQCAQCHNHPIAPEIEQRHYWGLVAFFNRSTAVDVGGHPGVAESAVGGNVKYATLSGDNVAAELVFLDGQVVNEPRPAEGEKEEDDPAKYLVPPKSEKEVAVPRFSRRSRLVEIATHDNQLLARAFVNRAWALLMGRGLVHPVDKIDSAHPPSHPHLLDWLSQDFGASGYNVRRLLREIVASRAYQLDSTPPAAALPPPELFSRGLEKPLGLEAFCRSLFVTMDEWPVEPQREALLCEQLAPLLPQLFAETYSASVGATLFLSNNKALDDLLDVRPGNLLDRVAQLDTDEERVEEMMLSAFGRRPEPDEAKVLVRYLATRQDRPKPAQRQALWALLASPEFRFNH